MSSLTRHRTLSPTRTLGLIIMAAISLPALSQAIEEAAYEVLRRDGPIEIRDYAPQTLAEVVVEGSLESAGDRAFRPLFRYISGDNQPRSKIAMTAPVSQQRAPGQSLAMTAPVSQQAQGDRWAVSFMMPSGYTSENLPVPDNRSITLRDVPAQRMAAIRYSGFWSESRYLLHKAKLEAWIADNNLEVTGPPVWARYNAPYVPWFFRRNEVLIPIASPLTAPEQPSPGGLPEALLEKVWQLSALGDQPLATTDGQRPPHLTFSPDSNLASGYAGCNHFSGTYQYQAPDQLRFSNTASTLMACPDMETEAAFLRALQHTTTFRLTDSTTLDLIDAEGKPLARFEVQPR